MASRGKAAFAALAMAAGLTGAACQAGSGSDSMKSADTIRRDLSIALPAGTSSDAVLAYLDRERIEHSQVSASGLSKDHKPVAGEQVIHAAVREPAGRKTVSRAVTIEFRFGADRKLTSIAVRDQFTGP